VHLSLVVVGRRGLAISTPKNNSVIQARREGNQTIPLPEPRFSENLGATTLPDLLLRAQILRIYTWRLTHADGTFADQI
jgi:hypothetical protein